MGIPRAPDRFTRTHEYREKQPFGQVPYLEETGRTTLFESGAIVLDVATRANKLLPDDAGERALAITWLISALNTVEPPLMNVAEVEYFLKDEDQKKARRPLVRQAAMQRLTELQEALGGRQYLAGGSFTAADLMMSSVLKIARNLSLMENLPSLRAYQDRCLGQRTSRP
jgi:glutathione S-transferase